MYYHFFLEKDYSPFISAYLIFNILFFIITPLAQITKIDPELQKHVNDLPYDWHKTIVANTYILIFNIVFFISYIVFKKRNNKVSSSNMNTKLLQ